MAFADPMDGPPTPLLLQLMQEKLATELRKKLEEISKPMIDAYVSRALQDLDMSVVKTYMPEHMKTMFEFVVRDARKKA